MHLVAMKDLIRDAYARHYAVGAFNTYNMESVQTVMLAARDLRSPVIIQAHITEVDNSWGAAYVDMVKGLGRDMDIVAAIHLDHGNLYQDALRCIRYGFTSVMLDGSALPFEENIELTLSVVKAAHAIGVTVEGELGSIGQTTELGEKISNPYFTDPDDAAAFVERTGVDCLAVAVGNAHGLYKKEPKLDLDRVKAIADRTRLPLVMHGGTGIPDDQIRESIRRGIAKVNFSTALRKAYIDSIVEYQKENPGNLSTMDLFAYASKSVYKVVADAMKMCGSEGKL
jgi:ketose-bisphosphate aldolase